MKIIPRISSRLRDDVDDGYDDDEEEDVDDGVDYDDDDDVNYRLRMQLYTTLIWYNPMTYEPGEWGKCFRKKT